MAQQAAEPSSRQQLMNQVVIDGQTVNGGSLSSPFLDTLEGG